MGFNRAGLDKWLMAVALGALMVVAGLSSTDKGWAVIGAAILVAALLIAALEVYSWTRKSQGKSTELPTPVVVVLCIVAVPVLGFYGFATGSVEALLVAAILVILLVLLFLLRNAPPIKIGQISMGQEIPLAKDQEPTSPAIKIMMKTADVPLLEREGSYLRGIFHALRGDTDSALDALRVSAGYDGDTGEQAIGRAVARLTERRYEEALAELDRVLSESPTGLARLLRGQVLLTIGATAEALADIEAAAKDLSLPGLNGMLGAAYLEAGRLDDAIVALKKASTEETATSGTLFTLGEAYRLSGQETEARAVYDDAAARAIVDAQYAVSADRGILPLALARQGKLDKAEEVVQQLIARQPNDPSVRIARALIEVMRGTPTSAIADLDQALQVNPHAVVKVLEDSDYAPLLSNDACQSLLERARADRERVLTRVRSGRSRPASRT